MRWIAIALLTTYLGGCSASVQSQANPRTASARADAALDAELDAELQSERDAHSSDNTAPYATTTAPNDLRGTSLLDPPGLRLALLGARHDLRLRSSGEQTCRCLTVHAGKPSDPMFVWEANPPQIDSESQLVIAFADDKQACGGNGAAYRGYQGSEGDIVILLEAAVPGRPALSGAIVPRPSGNGRLWIQPTPSELPYGQPRTTETTRCHVPFDGAVAFEQLDDDDARARSVTASSFGDATAQVSDDAPEDIPLDDGPHSIRDGFYLAAHPALEYPMVDLVVGDAAASASGFGFGFDLLLGTSVVPGLTLGGAVGGAAAPRPELTLTLPAGEQISERLDGASLNVFRLGAFADYYPFTALGFHILAELGYTSVGLSGASDDSESLHGLGANGGLGWDFWVSYHLSLGLLARLHWAALWGDGSEGTTLLTPALAATLTFH